MPQVLCATLIAVLRLYKFATHLERRCVRAAPPPVCSGGTTTYLLLPYLLAAQAQHGFEFVAGRDP